MKNSVVREIPENFLQMTEKEQDAWVDELLEDLAEAGYAEEDDEAAAERFAMEHDTADDEPEDWESLQAEVDYLLGD